MNRWSMCKSREKQSHITHFHLMPLLRHKSRNHAACRCSAYSGLKFWTFITITMTLARLSASHHRQQATYCVAHIIPRSVEPANDQWQHAHRTINCMSRVAAYLNFEFWPHNITSHLRYPTHSCGGYQRPIVFYAVIYFRYGARVTCKYCKTMWSPYVWHMCGQLRTVIDHYQFGLFG